MSKPTIPCVFSYQRGFHNNHHIKSLLAGPPPRPIQVVTPVVATRHRPRPLSAAGERQRKCLQADLRLATPSMSSGFMFPQIGWFFCRSKPTRHGLFDFEAAQSLDWSSDLCYLYQVVINVGRPSKWLKSMGLTIGIRCILWGNDQCDVWVCSCLVCWLTIEAHQHPILFQFLLPSFLCRICALKHYDEFSIR